MNYIDDYGRIGEICGSGRRHILLGNGFSIECDPVFQYPSLFGAAVDAGLSDRAQEVFKRLGTNNFEGVLRLLEDAHWAAALYGASPESIEGMVADAEIVKHTLVGAVTRSHLAHTGDVPDARKDAARAFLKPYYNVFTTNYDLLPYWVNMHGGAPVLQDGFREDDPDEPFVVFSERLGGNRGLFYLHGALHFFLNEGQLCKHCWSRTGQKLTDLIQAGLAEGKYPLFVAEGRPERKLEQIQRVGYLWYALDKFSRIQGPLVVFGHSLADSDGHIADAIADNPELAQLFVGLHGDPDSESNAQIRGSVDRILRRRDERLKRLGRSAKAKTLSAFFYRSETARPWR